MSTSKKGRGGTSRAKAAAKGRAARRSSRPRRRSLGHRGRDAGAGPGAVGPVWNGGARRSSTAAGGTTASSPGPWPTNRSKCRCSASSTCCPCCTRTRRSPAICRNISTRSARICRWAVRLGLEISQPNSVLGKALALNARRNAHAHVAAVHRRGEGRRSAAGGHAAPQAGLCLHARSSGRGDDQRARRRRLSASVPQPDRRAGPRGQCLAGSRRGSTATTKGRFRGSTSRSNCRPSTASFGPIDPAGTAAARQAAAAALAAVRPRARRLHPRRHGAVRLQGPDASRSSKRS